MVITILVLLGVFVSNYVHQLHEADQRSLLASQARLIANDLQSKAPRQFATFELRTLARQWAALENVRVTLISPSGTVLADSVLTATSLPAQSSFPEFVQAQQAGSGSALRFVAPLGEEYLLVTQRYSYNDQPIGYVTVSIPFARVTQAADQLRVNIWQATAGAGILTLLMSIAVASQTTRPISRLAEAVSKIADGEVSSINFAARTRDEVAQLTRAIESMATQLQERIEDLEIEQSKLSAILSQMRDAVLVADELGRVILLNDAAEELFETSSENALGRSLAQVLRRHEFIELWQRFQETSEEQLLAIENPQRTSYLQMIVSPFSQQLEGYTLLQFQDLTRMHQLETIRRDFVSNVSHELRTPLASLKALAETLRDGAIKDEKAAYRFLERIDVEVDTMTQMVLELLELSRIESGQVPLHMEKIDLTVVLRNAVSRMVPQAKRAKLKMIMKELLSPVSIIADSTRLEQVLINLLHNAIKFTPEGGEIEVAIDSLYEDEVVFIVRDSGIGIPREDHSRIFERFFKTDRARTSGGTGLGLAIARHLVEAHGGRIWVESREGFGSQFFVSLPRQS